MSGRVALALGKNGITVNAYAPGGVETRLRQSPFPLHREHLRTQSVLHVGAVDTFDDFLEPLAGPRAGRNGVSTSNIILSNPKYR